MNTMMTAQKADSLHRDLAFPRTPFTLEIDDIKPIGKGKKKLKWQRIDVSSAKKKYLFRIYSRRIGTKAVYTIGLKPPNEAWLELETVPAGVSFVQSRDGATWVCQMLHDGLPVKGAFVKSQKKGF